MGEEGSGRKKVTGETVGDGVEIQNQENTRGQQGKMSLRLQRQQGLATRIFGCWMVLIWIDDRHIIFVVWQEKYPRAETTSQLLSDTPASCSIVSTSIPRKV